MSEFTASNGVKITVSRNGDTYLLGQSLYDSNPGSYTEATASAEGIRALREFFQHERDEKLGRWRWPENPDYVVKEAMGNAFIYNEKSGVLSRWSRFDVESGRDGYGMYAARAYFAAHPESKPWHDAKPGEVWVVKTKYNDQERPVFVNSDGDFENAEEHFYSRHPNITAGYKVWPVSDE